MNRVFEVRQYQTKQALLCQNSICLLDCQSKFIERQVLQYMGAVNGGASIVAQSKTADDVSVLYVLRKPFVVLCI